VAPGEPGRSALRGAARGRGTLSSALRRDNALSALCARGAAVYRPFAALLADVFCFFYAPGASLGDGSGCDKLQHLVLKYLYESPVYGALRHRAAGKYQESLSATEEFGNRLLEHLARPADPGDRKEARADAAPTEMAEIKNLTFADVVTAGSGGPVDPSLLVLAKRVEGAIESAGVLTDLCNSWGIDPGQIRAMPWEQRSALGAKMANSASLKKLAELVGRWRALARARKAKRTPGVPEEVQDVSLGDDWPLFVPQELAALANSSLRYDFYLRMIDRAVTQYDPQSPDGRGKGPILVCLDTSGSMSGDRDISAKAAALALYGIAKKENRPFAAILFSSRDEWISFLFSGSQVVSRTVSGEEAKLSVLEGIVQTATFFFGGGTDYESPLNEAVRLIGGGGTAWGHADIVFITDDYCDVTKEFTERFAEQKRSMDFKVFSVIVGARAQDARTLRKFSDRVVSADQFDDEVAERVFDAI